MSSRESEVRGRDPGRGIGGRRAVGWREPSVLLLGLGCVLLVAVAYQAHAAVRSHRATVDRLLVDYARAAAWNYRQQADAELGEVVEHIYHPLLHDASADWIRSEAPTTELIRHRPHTEVSCEYDRIGELTEAVRYSLGEGIAVLDASISVDEARRIGEPVAAHVRSGALLRRSEGLLAIDRGGAPAAVAYSRQFVNDDTLVYALLIESQVLADLFERALDRGYLLPEPLVADLPVADLVTLRVSGAAGEELYRSDGWFAAEYAATETVAGPLGRLEASVGLSPVAAEHLVIGGLPGSRLPILLGLLALAAGLLAVALVQLRRDHELAAMRASFVASVSHELRTPLALQRVFLDTLGLGRAETPERRQWALGNIDRETRRLTHLVDNVLRFAQGTEGRIVLEPMPTDLAQAVEEIAEDMRPLAAADRTSLVVRTELAPFVVPVDPDALRQVLRNLIENAVKYGASEQTVTVTLGRAEDSAVITVDDQGPGIPAAERARIWDPFERGDSARSSAKGGSGIGLSVVRDLVRGHGGSVAVEDAPGGGARFRVSLPAAAGSGARPAPPATRVPGSPDAARAADG